MKRKAADIDKYVFIPEKRAALGELKKHTEEKGERFVFFDKNNFPKGNVYIITRRVKNIRKPYSSALPRKHKVDSIMLFLGFGKNLKGLKIKLLLEDREKMYESPVGLYVPKNTRCSYTIMSGSGLYFKILPRVPRGDYNKVTY